MPASDRRAKPPSEALALHKELERKRARRKMPNREKNAVLTGHGREDGKNYGDFPLDTVEAAKEQFTDQARTCGLK